MADEITHKEIDELPHFGKIAFVARCAQLAWKRVTKLGMIPPPEAQNALQTVELWGWDTNLCHDAKRVWKKKDNPLLTDPETQLLRRVQGFLNLPCSESVRTNHVAATIKAAVETGISKQGNPGPDDDEAGQHAFEAYGKASHAAKLTYYHEVFVPTAREDFNALRVYFRLTGNGSVPADFFEKREPDYYHPTDTVTTADGSCKGCKQVTPHQINEKTDPDGRLRCATVCAECGYSTQECGEDARQQIERMLSGATS
jgi:hypothetical protein